MENRNNKSVIILYISLLFFIFSSQETFCQETKKIYHGSFAYGITKISLPSGYTPQTGYLYVGYEDFFSDVHRGYIEFDLSTIPTGATITAASLHLYCNGTIGTNTTTGGTIHLKNLDSRPTGFYNSDDWAFLNGTSTFKSVFIDWGEEEVISGTDLINKINSSSDGYLYFGLKNSSESSNGISLAKNNADLYLSVTYTPDADPVPVTITYNTDKTSTVEFYPEAQETIYLTPGFRFKALTTSYIMKTKLVGSGGQAKSMVSNIDEETDETEPGSNKKELLIDKKNDLNSNEYLFETKVSLYPNPTTGQLSIRFQNLIEPAIVEISNLFGVVILSYELNQPETTIDFSDNPAGVYILKIFNGKEVITRKLIKK